MFVVVVAPTSPSLLLLSYTWCMHIGAFAIVEVVIICCVGVSGSVGVVGYVGDVCYVGVLGVARAVYYIVVGSGGGVGYIVDCLDTIRVICCVGAGVDGVGIADVDAGVVGAFVGIALGGVVNITNTTNTTDNVNNTNNANTITHDNSTNTNTNNTTI